MIRRLLFALALVVLPVAAFAQDQDLLLTSDGTLFTIESLFAQDLPDVRTPASQVLRLSTESNGVTSSIIVPESLLSGSHTSPALAYDNDTKTLFIFWERGLNNHLSSNLVFCFYRDGRFSPATSVDSGDFHRAHNLRIGITNRIELREAGKDPQSLPELTVHAIWWEETGSGEAARYAMLSFDKGAVTGIQLRDLSDFIASGAGHNVAPGPDFNPEILRHPALFEAPAHDAIDVVFGEFAGNQLHRLTVKPTIEARIRIPIGVKEGGIGSPNFKATTEGRVNAIASGSRLVFFNSAGGNMNYVTLSNGTWSALRSMKLTDRLTPEIATDVLRRMASAE